MGTNPRQFCPFPQTEDTVANDKCTITVAVSTRVCFSFCGPLKALELVMQKELLIRTLVFLGKRKDFQVPSE